MQVLKDTITIQKEVRSQNDLDYDFLRKKGIEYIESLGSALWTDYNAHDPGITILEMLCYAITDLGMRIDLPIEDLLSDKESLAKINQQFYRAADILPNKALTALDYRKLFIDLDGVTNIWVRAYEKEVYVDCKNDRLTYNPKDLAALPESQKKSFPLKGLYRLLVDFESDDASEQAKVIKAIKKCFHDNRNLCEDLISVESVRQQPVSVCADIEVETTADEEWVHAQVRYQLQGYFSTHVYFYSIDEMLQKGYSTPEIFEGPVLKNGFIDMQELKASELRSEIRLSDIINIIMEVPGVLKINDISMGNCDDDNVSQSVLCIDPDTKPVLCYKSTFNYNKDVLPLTINTKKFQAYLDQLEASDLERKQRARQNKLLTLPKGTYRNPGSYTTLMNDFPDTYGITPVGIPGKKTTQRKAQAKQLKGYLLFFDQILASYFKHLEKMREVLSCSGSLTQTFFTQAVPDIEGFSSLVKEYSTAEELLTDTLFGPQDNYQERRNEVLDHLIARFAERFTEYTFVMTTLYGASAEELVLKNKEDFLRDYSTFSGSRGLAFNYYKQPKEMLWDTNNVSGIQQRASRLLGILDYSRRTLSNSFVDLYTLVNSDDETVYRWRIRNAEGKIVLSGTEEYHDNFLATRELYFAVLQLIQTSVYEVERAFEQGFDDEIIIGNIQIHHSESGKYSFDVINPEITDTHHKDYIIAKRFNYFGSKETLKSAILELLQFMKYEFTEEGIFLVEHMLLRPDVTQTDVDTKTFLPICTDECTTCEPLDPYSYRVSIVIPGYTFRTYNTDFRNYMEQVIRRELPAHIMAKICWVGYRDGEVPEEENDLVQFEQAWKKYLFEKTEVAQEQPQPEQQELIRILSSLHNVYPTGRLYDCDDDVEELSGKVILGKTNLGSL
ncbi:MAG: hypothetical protein CMC35_06745 [Flavobacteriaceae bacterium]|nr:hypothetical protein [Flavobacteriaceae bacterium]|tara:strand:+ start:7381 stop:10071 length:2691 start_codon:yes stop_codon:yes gene_type:complete